MQLAHRDLHPFLTHARSDLLAILTDRIVRLKSISEMLQTSHDSDTHLFDLRDLHNPLIPHLAIISLPPHTDFNLGTVRNHQRSLQ